MSISKENSVEFVNHRRPARPWCDGYLQSETRIKKGVLQRLIFFECENSYLIWVNDDLIFSKKWGHSEGVERV